MKSAICPIVFNFFLLVAIFKFPFRVCDVNNKIIFMRVYLTKFLIKSSLFVCLLSFFFLFFFSPWYSFITVIIVITSSIITIINILSLKNLTLSLLLPLLLLYFCSSWYYWYYYICSSLFPFFNVAIVIKLTLLLLSLWLIS